MKTRSFDGAACAAMILLTLINLIPLKHYVLDDAYITYRYSLNLAQGHGFVYNLHQHVLGITTPGYALLLAGVYKLLHAPLPTTSWVCAILFTILGGIAFYALLKSQFSPWAALFGGALYVSDPLLSYAVGMETSLYCLLIVLAAYTLFVRQKRIELGLILGLAAMVRPDALVLFALPLAALAMRRIDVKFFLTSAGVAVLTLLPWLIFSDAYFGSVVTHTLAAKSGSHNDVSAKSHEFWRGLGFQPKNHIKAHPLYALFLPILALGVRQIFRLRPLPTLGLLLWAALYVLGFSILRAVNYFVWYWTPLQIAMFSVSAAGIDALLQLLSLQPVRWRQAATAAVAVAAGILLFLQTSESISTASANPRFLVYAQVAQYLASHDPNGQTIAAWEIGVLGYHCSLPIVDMNGLVTPLVTEEGQNAAIARYQPLYTVDASFPGYEPVRSFPVMNGSGPGATQISSIQVYRKTSTPALSGH